MLCRITRWLIDRHLAGKQVLPEFARAHIGRCSACRRHQSFCQQLIEQLSEPAELSPPTSPALRAVIIRRLQMPPAGSTSETPGGLPAPFATRPETSVLSSRHYARNIVLCAALATAAGIALLALIAVHLARPSPPSVAVKPPALAASLHIPLIDPAAALQDSARAVEDLAQQMAHRELDTLYNDAVAAGQMLLASLPIDVIEFVTAPASNEPK